MPAHRASRENPPRGSVRFDTMRLRVSFRESLCERREKVLDAFCRSLRRFSSRSLCAACRSDIGLPR